MTRSWGSPYAHKMEQKKIDRINELARISKTRPLTETEKSEQAALRGEYLAEVRASFGETLAHTVVLYPDGTKKPLQKTQKRDGTK